MNLDDADNPDTNPPPQKKLSRKEKKALKKAEKEAKLEAKRAEKEAREQAAAEAKQNDEVQQAKVEDEAEDADVELEPAPIPVIPPPDYTAWEKISPPARRKRQIANMEDGFRQILGLVQSMRENQEALLESYKKLPEAVDSVKQLADHSAQQSELLKAMNEQMGGGGAAGKFNDTLASMDKTTQLLLERAQRSEERLYNMLRRSQRRIALMTLLVCVLFIAVMATVMGVVYPEQTKSWLAGTGFTVPEATEPAANPTAEPSPTAAPSPTATATPEPTILREMDPPVIVEDPQPMGDPLTAPPPESLDVIPPEDIGADSESAPDGEAFEPLDIEIPAPVNEEPPALPVEEDAEALPSDSAPGMDSLPAGRLEDEMDLSPDGDGGE